MVKHKKENGEGSSSKLSPLQSKSYNQIGNVSLLFNVCLAQSSFTGSFALARQLYKLLVICFHNLGLWIVFGKCSELEGQLELFVMLQCSLIQIPQPSITCGNLSSKAAYVLKGEHTFRLRMRFRMRRTLV